MSVKIFIWVTFCLPTNPLLHNIANHECLSDIHNHKFTLHTHRNDEGDIKYFPPKKTESNVRTLKEKQISEDLTLMSRYSVACASWVWGDTAGFL